VTAENVAKKYKISREDQDVLAVESHRRAGVAIDKGFLKAQIVPIEIKVKRDKVPFLTDETVEKLGKLPTVFDPEGTVTAGNASSINDAAAALVLADGEYAKKRGLKPIGRLIGYAYAGVDPKYMGIGPVPAVQKLLKKTGFSLDDIDVFEVNEAFAAQALAVCRELNLLGGPHQSQRQRYLAGPPHWSHWRHPDSQGALRAGPDRRQACAGHDVHRRRSRDRDDFRTPIDPHRIRSSTKRQMRQHHAEQQALKMSQCFFCLDLESCQPLCFSLASAAKTVTIGFSCSASWALIR
jgi:hypothetical protein